jgi:hypothetical protein
LTPTWSIPEACPSILHPKCLACMRMRTSPKIRKRLSFSLTTSC